MIIANSHLSGQRLLAGSFAVDFPYSLTEKITPVDFEKQDLFLGVERGV